MQTLTIDLTTCERQQWLLVQHAMEFETLGEAAEYIMVQALKTMQGDSSETQTQTSGNEQGGINA